MTITRLFLLSFQALSLTIFLNMESIVLILIYVILLIPLKFQIV